MARAVDLDISPNNPRISAIAFVPQSVADDDHMIPSGLFFVGGKSGSIGQLNAQQRKELGGDQSPADAFRFAVSRQIPLRFGDRGDAGKSRRVPAPFQVVLNPAS